MFSPVGAGHLIKWIHFFSTLSLSVRASLLSGVSVMKPNTLICMSDASWFGCVKCSLIGSILLGRNVRSFSFPSRAIFIL